MKPHLSSKFNIFKTMSQWKLLLNYSTTPAVDQTESKDTLILNKQKKQVDRVLFTPSVTTDVFQALNNITGFTVATNNVSWAKILIPSFTLLEWNTYTLPYKFGSSVDDAHILTLANTIRQTIPNSDMFVVENCPFKTLVFKEHILRIALIVLLNCLEKDVEMPSKIVFQKPFILNTLCSIIVGAERTSASQIVKNILISDRNGKGNAAEDCRTPECFSLVNISEEQKQAFLCSDLARQESLSLALLITLTFSELNIIRNPKSIAKIQDKLQMKSRKNVR